MFGNKNTPCTVTVEELPDVCDDILISTNEYKELLRKEVAMDIICSIANDQAAKEEMRYSWDAALRLILKHALPEKFVPDEPEAEEDGEGDA